MVEPKAGPGGDEAHERADDDVEAVVAEVGISRGGYVDGGGDGGECGDEEVERGCGGGGLVSVGWGG